MTTSRLLFLLAFGVPPGNWSVPADRPTPPAAFGSDTAGEVGIPTRPVRILSPTNGGGEVEIVLTLEHLGILVHRSTDARGIPSNGLIAFTGAGLLLVDTAWTEAQTEAILSWGERALERPWIGAVITHDHADRDGGLGALVRRHIPTAALDLTVDKLAKRGVGGVGVLFAAKDAQFADPRGFEALYPGPGHTSDNIVLRFPKGVVYGGCLIKSLEANDLGFTGDANLAAWPAAVRRVAAQFGGNADGRPTIVPGHGAVDQTGAAFRHTLDLLSGSPKP